MSEDLKSRSAAIALGCIWMIMLAVLSFLPNQDKLLLHTTGHYHRWGHLAGFLTVTLLLASSVTSLRAKFSLAAVVVSFGFFLEYVEHIVYSNALERSDIRIDTLGVVLGLIIVLVREEFNRIRGFDQER
jgi:uncharacterized membrane protein